ncbi:N2227-like protein-domain-containing protein [Irpex lacteus]|nr:N2227-like protein-domain-containing protein [Irpex lacteus]
MGDFSADVVLACLLPLSLFLITFIWIGMPTLSFRTIMDIIKGRTSSPGYYSYFSRERAVASYDLYHEIASAELAAMRKSYTKLGRAHKHIGYALGYPAKLDRLQATIEANDEVVRAIGRCAREAFPWMQRSRLPEDGDISRVRETLKHFIRDWSSEGASERGVIFQPILEVLALEDAAKRSDMKVLVPGAGLCRLAWDISRLGFDATAVEISYFMTLAFRFLCSREHTGRTEQHTLHPYSFWFSHQSKNENLFRGITFPDTLPNLSSKLQLVEGDFLAHPRPGDGYDYIVTLFFIDTSMNVISTLEQIYSLLRPGGQWINLGPLLWPSGAQARVELSLEEVFNLARMVGFEIEEGEDVPEAKRRKTVPAEYTADRHAMMKWIYQAEFWVATKPES